MRILVCILFAVVVTGCQDVKRPEKPEDLIAKSKMIDVLTEAYLMNAARSYDLRLIRNKGVQLDSLIYKRFKIDSVQFARSNAFYTSDLNEYNEILTEVESRLLVMQNNADSLDMLIKQQRMEARKKDSTAGRPYDTSVDTIEDEQQQTRDSIQRAAQLIEPEISQ